MQEFETLTCVDFVTRSNEPNAIQITSGAGCWSYVGMNGGLQEVSISQKTCMIKGVIQHEINHALGFVHEHVRDDRDNYVDIITENIQPALIGNFEKENTVDLKIVYDYVSVMHYPRNAYSISPSLDTIVPKPDPNIEIGQKYGLTNLDILKINALYRCDVCSTLLSDISGTMFSPNYPSLYSNNAKCVWLIRIPSKQVSIQFVAFDVQNTPNCASDYIKIYNGATRSDPVLWDKTCGSVNLPPIVSTSNLMLIEFVTDGERPMTGFKALYNTVSCGGTFTSLSTTFTSPGYPTAYPSNANCTWSIMAPVGFKIVLTILSIEVELSSSCRYDSLTIYDGTNTAATVLRRACGSLVFGNQVSTGRYMLVVFSSDASGQAKGFQVLYTTIPKIS
ncbi:hypothetical protein GDO86_016398 [Hymenochirus boettgeri]|uniref:Metalloendopeptidase n=1 Tax=Hymenochirus boettgeri TaxID=247094 RepID=A0A8T2K088_9PIPI|nr:hypothetical protein GDO86_016398 [Hymenochirus boettgeri]